MEGAGAGARTMIPEGMQEFISTSPCSTFQAVGVSGSERTTSQAPGSPLPSSSFEKSYILRSMKCRYRLRLRLGSLALPPFISTGLPGTLEAGLAEPWWMSGVGMEAWSRLLGCNLPPPACPLCPSSPGCVSGALLSIAPFSPSTAAVARSGCILALCLALLAVSPAVHVGLACSLGLAGGCLVHLHQGRVSHLEDRPSSIAAL